MWLMSYIVDLCVQSGCRCSQAVCLFLEQFYHTGKLHRHSQHIRTVLAGYVLGACAIVCARQLRVSCQPAHGGVYEAHCFSADQPVVGQCVVRSIRVPTVWARHRMGPPRPACSRAAHCPADVSRSTAPVYRRGTCGESESWAVGQVQRRLLPASCWSKGLSYRCV